MPNWTGGTGRAGTWLEICAAFMKTGRFCAGSMNVTSVFSGDDDL